MSCKLYSLDGKTCGLPSSNPYVSWIINPVIKYSVVFQSRFQRLSFRFLFIFWPVVSKCQKRVIQPLAIRSEPDSSVTFSMYYALCIDLETIIKYVKTTTRNEGSLALLSACLMLTLLNAGRRDY